MLGWPLRPHRRPRGRLLALARRAPATSPACWPRELRTPRPPTARSLAVGQPASLLVADAGLACLMTVPRLPPPTPRGARGHQRSAGRAGAPRRPLGQPLTKAPPCSWGPSLHVVFGRSRVPTLITQARVECRSQALGASSLSPRAPWVGGSRQAVTDSLVVRHTHPQKRRPQVVLSHTQPESSSGASCGPPHSRLHATRCRGLWE